MASAPTPSPAPYRVLVVDDDPIAAQSLADFIAEEGHRSGFVLSAEEAIATLNDHQSGRIGDEYEPVSVLITDAAMPGMGGLDLLKRVAKEHPGIAVLVLTGYGTIENAVEAVRLGAVDYLTKPVVDAELRLALQRAFRQHALLSENQQLKSRLEERFGLDKIVGSDQRMLKLYDLIEAVAPSRTTVLMTGESGVGKSMIAQAIHQRSPRRDKPFIQLSCGSIPETLLESELFGHTKGSFTGAHADKIGRFLAADGGTIFLDEINSASPGMQLKLLRVLQERKFEPVGSTQTLEVDVRVLLATNKPLEDLVARGEFRQDLYYRINVVTLELPPLRDRISDVSLLAMHFLDKHAKIVGRELVGFTPEAMDMLRRYQYPGNVRELENIVERASVLTKTPTIGVEALPEHLIAQVTGAASPRLRLVGSSTSQTAAPADAPWVATPLEDALREPEKLIILRALLSSTVGSEAWNSRDLKSRPH